MTRFAVTWFLAALIVGCAGEMTTAARRARAPVDEVYGPHVPAGSRFTARLVHSIESAPGVNGARFEAALDSEVRTNNGQVLVPAGALVRGRLTWVGSRQQPIVADATVETVVGPLPLEAALRGSALREAMASGTSTRDVHPAPRTGEVNRAHARPATLETEESAALPAGQFVVPRGTPVRLVLTRPLLAPGAGIVHAAE